MSHPCKAQVKFDNITSGTGGTLTSRNQYKKTQVEKAPHRAKRDVVVVVGQMGTNQTTNYFFGSKKGNTVKRNVLGGFMIG